MAKHGNLNIRAVANGYIVTHTAHPHDKGEEWVAKDVEELGNLVKELCNQEIADSVAKRLAGEVPIDQKWTLTNGAGGPQQLQQQQQQGLMWGNNPSTFINHNRLIGDALIKSAPDDPGEIVRIDKKPWYRFGL